MTLESKIIGTQFERFLHRRLPGSILQPENAPLPDLYIPEINTYVEAKAGSYMRGAQFEVEQLERFSTLTSGNLVYAVGLHNFTYALSPIFEKRPAKLEKRFSKKLSFGRVIFLSQKILARVLGHYTRKGHKQPTPKAVTIPSQDRLSDGIVAALPNPYPRTRKRDELAFKKRKRYLSQKNNHFRESIWDAALHKGSDAAFISYLQNLGIISDN